MAEPNPGKIFQMPNIYAPPPPLPPAFGTALYPPGTDPLIPYVPAEHQMWSISHERKLNERDYILRSKSTGYMLLREQHQDNNRYCSTCSEFSSLVKPGVRPIFHQHNSSKNYRISAPVDLNANYPCTTCAATPHSHKTGIRYPILLSSSILNLWQGRRTENQYPGDDIHIDYLTIPGATIKTLHHALLAEYESAYRPIDVLLVSGLNDILRGRTSDQVISDMERLVSAVMDLPRSNDCGALNTIGISTLPFPPKMSVIPSDKRRIRGNKFEELSYLNDQIMNLNETLKLPSFPSAFVPKFHTWGLQTTKAPTKIRPRNKLAHTTGHKIQGWREEELRNMLHLNNHLRLKMGKSCVSYFKVLYGIIPCRAPSKNAGLQLEKERTRQEN